MDFEEYRDAKEVDRESAIVESRRVSAEGASSSSLYAQENNGVSNVKTRKQRGLKIGKQRGRCESVKIVKVGKGMR